MPGVIEAPPSRRATLSLLNSSTFPEADSRWEMGFKFAPNSCNGVFVEDPCRREPRVVGDRPDLVDITPFNVVAGDRCSAFGWNEQNYEERARTLLERCQSKAVAHEFWTGDQAIESGWDNQYLARISADTLTSGATGLIAGLACLEQGLADAGCGERGMIHATPQVVTHWAALGNSVLRREGGLLLTIHDTIVVSDAGYPGTGPNGEPAADSQWAYATGFVSVRLGPVGVSGSFAENFDRRDNTVEWFAERPAAAYYDGCALFAVELDLGVCLVGGAS